ncbi:hypothetical protein BDB00DRAFT_871059 [Zychaea mexicana]|uniref:uncharacterized protein n=1 Tax=Zychaea mexicana TaxID=64656 RepID=UPI0022FDEE76|nr:uncharacterized protein BDB00DRAFT_871059 [Zychaea mexicana]KAI9494785.1 hypothetical protein BDB00DRAFT_871059 [Zychaea mexicana]
MNKIVDNFQIDFDSDCRVDVNSVKASWIRNISQAAESLDEAKESWKTIERQLKDTLNAISSNKTRIHDQNKKQTHQHHQHQHRPRRRRHQTHCLKTYSTWYSHVVSRHCAEQAKQGLTVEIGRDPVLSCCVAFRVYQLTLPSLGPSQSLIVNLGDSSWLRVLTEEELDELREAGGASDFSAPKELEQNFQEILKLKDSTELYNYARSIPIVDPSKKTLKVWLSIEFQNIAQLFLKTGSFDIGTMMETDQLYLVFGFLSSVARGSDIAVKGYKGSSEANADVLNNDRQLSSVKPRRGDIIFKSGKLELGCAEIGAAKNQTKEMRDSLLRLPIVLRDMLLLATFPPLLLHKCHIIGYSISGGSVSLMGVDIPKGFVTGVRRTEYLDFPDNNKTLVSS